MAAGSSDSVTQTVRRFYDQMPFNYYSTPEAATANIASNPILSYPDLDVLLQDDGIGQVLEIGCGAGWASNSIALHYDRHVTAVDMTEKALTRAAEVSRLLGVADRTTFIQSDLFDFRPPQPVDLVISIGVLHHTHDCRAAFDHVCSLVAPDGFLFVGLYHQAGRQVFLNMFHAIVAHEGEEAAFRRFASMDLVTGDGDHVQSWFRDQVLHPHETQHSLVEVLGWLEANGMELVTTSIDGFAGTQDRQVLAGLEAGYAQLSQKRNITENRFFPGFFTVLCHRV